MEWGEHVAKKKNISLRRHPLKLASESVYIEKKGGLETDCDSLNNDLYAD